VATTTADDGVAADERVAVGADERVPALGLGVTARLAVVPTTPWPDTAVVQPLSSPKVAHSTNTRPEHTARV
jgi:hypothetical protein